jgi:hypothetical protein
MGSARQRACEIQFSEPSETYLKANFREIHKAEVQLRRIVFSRHTSVNSAATIAPPTTKDYFRFPRGTSLAQCKTRWHLKRRNGHMDRDNREGRSAAAGGSGGGTQEDRWTEEDFKRRVRERLDTIEQHLERIDQRLERVEGHGEGPSGGRGGGRGEGRGGRGEGRGEGHGEGRDRRRRGG